MVTESPKKPSIYREIVKRLSQTVPTSVAARVVFSPWRGINLLALPMVFRLF
jgi:hypothetical protein